MLLKPFLAVVAGAVLFVAAGLSGLLFRLWPTGWPDAELSVSAAQVERLFELRKEPKFLPNAKLHYPGAPDEAMRIELEEIVNDAIEHIMQGDQKVPRKSFVLGSLKPALARAERLDSEERDRLLAYFDEVTEILELGGSNELLNVWRYGLPYGWFQSGA